METNTLVWTKDNEALRFTDTVIKTVKVLGKGQITASNIVWCINMQIHDNMAIWRVDETRVRRILNDCVRYGYLAGFTKNGHGVYRYAGRIPS